MGFYSRGCFAISLVIASILLSIYYIIISILTLIDYDKMVENLGVLQAKGPGHPFVSVLMLIIQPMFIIISLVIIHSIMEDANRARIGYTILNEVTGFSIAIFVITYFSTYHAIGELVLAGFLLAAAKFAVDSTYD